jgi:hypothetical protein
MERKYSNRYVEFLYHWETSRRIKKQVQGPPENYQHREYLQAGWQARWTSIGHSPSTGSQQLLHA